MRMLDHVAHQAWQAEHGTRTTSAKLGQCTWSMSLKEGLSGKGILPRMKPEKK